MEDVGKDLSLKIMETLKDILPKGTAFVMVCGDLASGDLGITSNIPDEVALAFLEEAIHSIQTEPAIDLEKEVN
jgi:hypothetical protein